MSARRILSVPVSDKLGDAVRLAASGDGATVAAWVRTRLLNALRRPEPRPPTLRASLLPLGRIPRAWSVTEAASLLALSPSALRRKIHAGQLSGYQQSDIVYDPGRGRYLRRRRRMIPGPALFTWMEEQSAYAREHLRRPYTRRPAELRPAGSVSVSKKLRHYQEGRSLTPAESSQTPGGGDAA